MLNYPRYIPTTVELCKSSFTDIIDKLKADLAYFKDDFQNEEIFRIICRPTGNIPHPGPGHGAGIPNPLDTSMGSPGSTTPRGTPLPELLQCHLQEPPQSCHQGHPCSTTEEYPCWFTQKHTCAITMTSTPAKKNYTIWKSASTSTLTSTSATTTASASTSTHSSTKP